MKRILLILVGSLTLLTPAHTTGVLFGLVNGTVPVSVDPATTAWVNQVVTNGGSVSAGRKTIVNTFIVCMKTASLWTTLDRYWLLAGENSASELTDMVNLQSAANVGSPTFTASQGVAAVDSSNYVNTAFTPSSSGVNAILNSSTYGAVIQTNRTTTVNVGEYGAADAGFSNVTSLNGHDISGNSNFRVNSSSSDSVASTTAKGSWLASRTGASAGALYLNGASVNSVSATSTALPNAPVSLGAINQGGSIVSVTTDQLSAFFTGAGLNSTQAAAFETCQNAMMTSIGINVH